MVLLPMRVEWRSATVEYGDQFVTMAGATGMQLLCVCNWDIKEPVSRNGAYTV